MNLYSLFPAKAGQQPRPNRYYGFVFGIVTNNHDPEGLGRVRLHFPWLHEEGDESAWARIAQPMAGSGMGWFVLPEIDDEVVRAFEQGDIRFPYVIGCVYNGQQLPPSAGMEDEYHANRDGGNHYRYFHSRSGHVMAFDDSNSGIQVRDSTGLQTFIIDDETDTVTITADKDILFTAATKDIILLADGGISLTSDGGNVTMATPGAICVEAALAVELQARGGKLGLSSGRTVTVGAPRINLTGGRLLSVQAPKTTITDGGKLLVSQRRGNFEAEGMFAMLSDGTGTVQAFAGDLKVGSPLATVLKGGAGGGPIGAAVRVSAGGNTKLNGSQIALKAPGGGAQDAAGDTAAGGGAAAPGAGAVADEGDVGAGAGGPAGQVDEGQGQDGEAAPDGAAPGADQAQPDQPPQDDSDDPEGYDRGKFDEAPFDGAGGDQPGAGEQPGGDQPGGDQPGGNQPGAGEGEPVPADDQVQDQDDAIQDLQDQIGQVDNEADQLQQEQAELDQAFEDAQNEQNQARDRAARREAQQRMREINEQLGLIKDRLKQLGQLKDGLNGILQAQVQMKGALQLLGGAQRDFLQAEADADRAQEQAQQAVQDMKRAQQARKKAIDDLIKTLARHERSLERGLRAAERELRQAKTPEERAKAQAKIEKYKLWLDKVRKFKDLVEIERDKLEQEAGRTPKDGAEALQQAQLDKDIRDATKLSDKEIKNAEDVAAERAEAARRVRESARKARERREAEAALARAERKLAQAKMLRDLKKAGLEREQARQRAEQAEDKADAAREKTAEAKERKEKADERLAQARERLARARKELEEAIKELEAAKKVLEQAKKRQEAAKAGIAKAEEKLEKKQAAADRARSRTRKKRTEKELEEAKQDKLKAEAEKTTADAEVDRATAAVAAAETKKASAESGIAAAEATSEEAQKKEIAEAEAEAKAADEEVAKAEEEQAAAEEEEKKAKSDLDKILEAIGKLGGVLGKGVGGVSQAAGLVAGGAGEPPAAGTLLIADLGLRPKQPLTPFSACYPAVWLQMQYTPDKSKPTAKVAKLEVEVTEEFAKQFPYAELCSFTKGPEEFDGKAPGKPGKVDGTKIVFEELELEVKEEPQKFVVLGHMFDPFLEKATAPALTTVPSVTFSGKKSKTAITRRVFFEDLLKALPQEARGEVEIKREEGAGWKRLRPAAAGVPWGFPIGLKDGGAVVVASTVPDGAQKYPPLTVHYFEDGSLVSGWADHPKVSFEPVPAISMAQLFGGDKVVGVTRFKMAGDRDMFIARFEKSLQQDLVNNLAKKAGDERGPEAEEQVTRLAEEAATRAIARSEPLAWVNDPTYKMVVGDVPEYRFEVAVKGSVPAARSSALELDNARLETVTEQDGGLFMLWRCGLPKKAGEASTGAPSGPSLLMRVDLDMLKAGEVLPLPPNALKSAGREKPVINGNQSLRVLVLSQTGSADLKVGKPEEERKGELDGAKVAGADTGGTPIELRPPEDGEPKLTRLQAIDLFSEDKKSLVFTTRQDAGFDPYANCRLKDLPTAEGEQAWAQKAEISWKIAADTLKVEECKEDVLESSGERPYRVAPLVPGLEAKDDGRRRLLKTRKGTVRVRKDEVHMDRPNERDFPSLGVLAIDDDLSKVDRVPLKFELDPEAIDPQAERAMAKKPAVRITGADGKKEVSPDSYYLRWDRPRGKRRKNYELRIEIDVTALRDAKRLFVFAHDKKDRVIAAAQVDIRS